MAVNFPGGSKLEQLIGGVDMKALFEADFDEIDEYLRRMSDGDLDLEGTLSDEDHIRFLRDLSCSLHLADPRAPARAVMFSLLADELIPLHSNLGCALYDLLGEEIELTTNPRSRISGFASEDLYQWWCASRKKYCSFDLLDQASCERRAEPALHKFEPNGPVSNSSLEA